MKLVSTGSSPCSLWSPLLSRTLGVAAVVLTTISAAPRASLANDCIAVPENATLPASFQAVDVPAGAIRRAQTTMGTALSLGASNVDCSVATRAFAEVYLEFDRLERLTSTKIPDSDLSQVNAAAGKAPVKVAPEVFALVELALSFAEQSAGAFDPTFAAMDEVWSFEEGAVVAPPQDITLARSFVDYRKVILDKEAQTIFLEKLGMRLSLGGFAKGYATDNAVTILKRHGLKDFIIRSGGEVFILGNPGGDDRRVGIPRPRGTGAMAKVALNGRALNISRDIERSFVVDDARYHHIIDPRTGYPAHHVRTVALVADRAATADALSTAVFVLGPARGLKLVESLPNVEAMVVDSEHRLHLSSHMSDLARLMSVGPQGEN